MKEIFVFDPLLTVAISRGPATLIDAAGVARLPRPAVLVENGRLVTWSSATPRNRRDELAALVMDALRKPVVPVVSVVSGAAKKADPPVQKVEPVAEAVEPIAPPTRRASKLTAVPEPTVASPVPPIAPAPAPPEDAHIVRWDDTSTMSDEARAMACAQRVGGVARLEELVGCFDILARVFVPELRRLV